MGGGFASHGGSLWAEVRGGEEKSGLLENPIWQLCCLSLGHHVIDSHHCCPDLSHASGKVRVLFWKLMFLLILTSYS